eukprot:10223296-Karenia_brevis.AAC.1
MERINARRQYGISARVNRRSNEFSVVDQDSIRKVRSIRRINVEKRWSDNNLKSVKWGPWRRYEHDQEADGDVPER